MFWLLSAARQNAGQMDAHIIMGVKRENTSFYPIIY